MMMLGAQERNKSFGKAQRGKAQSGTSAIMGFGRINSPVVEIIK